LKDLEDFNKEEVKQKSLNNREEAFESGVWILTGRRDLRKLELNIKYGM